MKNTLTEAKFHKIIREHKENPSVDTMGDAFECFWILANNILKYIKIKSFKHHKMAFKNKTNTMAHLVAFAFIKIERYNPDKGRAFSYFTTIMLSWLRQVYRTRTKYADLKAKYEEKIRNSGSEKEKVHRRGK